MKFFDTLTQILTLVNFWCNTTMNFKCLLMQHHSNSIFIYYNSTIYRKKYNDFQYLYFRLPTTFEIGLILTCLRRYNQSIISIITIVLSRAHFVIFRTTHFFFISKQIRKAFLPSLGPKYNILPYVLLPHLISK